MGKGLPVRKWLASVICATIMLGSIAENTSFAAQANRYTASGMEVREEKSDTATESNADSDNPKEMNTHDFASSDILPMMEQDKKTTLQQIDKPDANREKIMMKNPSSQLSESRVSEQETQSASKESESTSIESETGSKEGEIDPEPLQNHMEELENNRAVNIKDGFIHEEFVGTVSFNGSGLQETISNAYLEIKVIPEMLSGIPDDWNLSAVDDGNQSIALPGFRLENASDMEYISSVTYYFDTSEDGVRYLCARAKLHPLTAQTNGSIEYHIRFKEDGSVPNGYILPVQACFYYESGEELLKMEKAYFRVFYPASSVEDDVTDTLPSISPVQETEESPATLPTKNPVEESANVETPIEEAVPDDTKKRVETADIRAELKWEGDLNARIYRPGSIRAVLYRTDSNAEHEIVSEVELSNRSIFNETWSSVFEDVELTDANGQEYTFHAELVTDEQSGIKNYMISDPIPASDRSKFTWIGKYHPISLTGKIRWEDNQNEHQVRPNFVKVQLARRTADGEITNIGSEISIHSGSWQHEFGAFPRFDESGRELEYLLLEIEDDGLKNYPSSLETSHGNIPNRIFSFHEGIMTITNSVQEMKIPVNVHWNEKQVGSRFRPKQVELKLIRDNGSSLHSITKVFSGEKDEEFWTGAFDNLVKYDINGNEYRYYLIENNSSYSRNYDLFNTYKTGDTIHIVNQLTLTEETVSLTWDVVNRDLIPNEVGLELYRSTVGSIPQLTDFVKIPSFLSEYTFADLPKFDERGQVYFYQIRQDKSAGNYRTEYQKDGNTTHIVNRFQGLSLDLQIQWTDGSQKDRPENVEVRLLRRTDEEPYVEVPGSVLNLSTGQSLYQDAYRDLPEFSANGKKYEYRIEAISNTDSAGYRIQTSRIDDQTFEIRFIRENAGLDLRVDWIDFENKYRVRPEEFQIQLYEVNRESGRKKVGDPILITNENSKEEGNSRVIHLTDIESVTNNREGKRYYAEILPGGATGNYSFEMVSDTDLAGNVLVINGTLQTQTVFAKLDWIGNDDRNLRPKRVSIRLSRYQNGIRDEEFEELIFVDSDKTQEGLAKVVRQDSAGRSYEYRAKMMNPNSLMNYRVSEKTSEGAFVFTMEYNPIDVLLRIHWEDQENIHDLRPGEVEFKLARRLKNTANPYSKVSGFEFVLDTNDKSQVHRFQHLPKYDANGNEYEYGIFETNDPGFMKNYETKMKYHEKTHVIELHSKLMLKTIEVETDWIGDLNRESERPAYLVVELYRKSETEKSTPVQTKHIRGTENIWTGKFRDLPYFDEAGYPYEYEVKIHDVQNYILTPVNRNPDKFVFTLQLDVKTIKAKAVWNDRENEYGLRPNFILVKLQRSIDQKNYEYVGDPIMIQAPNWVANIGALPSKDVFGNTYDYRLEEVEQPSLRNYSQGVFSDQMYRFYDNTIIISHDLKLMDIPVRITWEKSESAPKEIEIKLTRFGSTPIPTFTKNADYNASEHSYEAIFEDMPVYDAKGNAFDYRVRIGDIRTGAVYSGMQVRVSDGVYDAVIR